MTINEKKLNNSLALITSIKVHDDVLKRGEELLDVLENKIDVGPYFIPIASFESVFNSVSIMLDDRLFELVLN